MRRCAAICGLAALVIGSLFAGGGALASASCAGSASGGEWSSFGHDATGSRSQPLEDQITPATAPSLMKKWAFSIASAGGTGNFQSVPVTDGGCLFVGTSTGWVFAVNADTGELVWKQNLVANGPYGLGTLSGGMFGLGVMGGRVYANVSVLGAPYMAAMDEHTGVIDWQTVVSNDPTAYTNSSVAFINGMVFIGISGPEDVPANGPRHPGGFALLDPTDGHVIVRTFTVSEAEDARGEKGVSLWGTAVWDEATGFMYDGTGQPANKAREATLSNSIIKVDANRGSDTLGAIVGAYHGNWDRTADIDFGGSPTLFTDSHGNTLIGAVQKDGVFQVAFADTMDQAWWTRVGGSPGAGAPAFDGHSIYIGAGADTSTGSPGAGNVNALNADDGKIRWTLPVADGLDYHSMATAGGVVYAMTTSGVLIGADAANGVPLAVRPLSLDAGDACATVSGGVSVARHTVYATCDIGAAGGGWIVAYGANSAIPPLPVDPDTLPALP